MKNKNTSSPPKNGASVTLVKHKLILAAAGNREDGSGLDKKSLKELADTIREHGIVQPLTVRTHPGQKNHFELICGERRWRAAEIAELDECPCILRECGDAEAIAIRAIENLHREGISELEEAKNYSQLLALRDEKSGEPLYTFETLAGTLGKSPVWVRARVKLLDLPDLGKLALNSGKLHASVALLISRILNPADAHKATLEVLVAQNFGRTPDEESALDEERAPMSYRAAKDHIQDKYMKRLKGAPFDQEDAGLVPVSLAPNGGAGQGEGGRAAGGKCSDCPFRTGNMKKTYPDAESADVCTNTDCFKKKVLAHQKAEKQKFEAKGQKLLKDNQAKKILTYGGDGVSPASGYVDLRAKMPGSKKTYEEALDGHLPPDFIPEVARGKKNFLVAPVAVIAEAAKAAGIKVETPKAAEPRESYEQQQERRNALKRQSLEIAQSALPLLTRAITKDKPEPFLQFLAFHLLDHGYADRHDLKGGDAGLHKHLKGLSDGELRYAIMEAQFLAGDVTGYQGDLREEFVELCSHYDVDLKAIAKELKARARNEPAKLEGEKEGEVAHEDVEEG